MNMQSISSLKKCLSLQLLSSRSISFTPINNLNQRWRESKGLPTNPNAYGVLTDSPDYSFLDGRPTPYGSRQRRRMLQNKDTAEKIITLTKEVDFAHSRYQQLQVEEEMKKKQILDNKLKPKGSLLLGKQK